MESRYSFFCFFLIGRSSPLFIQYNYMWWPVTEMSWLSSKEGLGWTYVTLARGEEDRHVTQTLLSLSHPEQRQWSTPRHPKHFWWAKHPSHANGPPSLEHWWHLLLIFLSERALTLTCQTMVDILLVLSNPVQRFHCLKEGHGGAHSIQPSGLCQTSAKSSVKTYHRWGNGDNTTSGPSSALASIKFTWNVF